MGRRVWYAPEVTAVVRLAIAGSDPFLHVWLRQVARVRLDKVCRGECAKNPNASARTDETTSAAREHRGRAPWRTFGLFPQGRDRRLVLVQRDGPAVSLVVILHVAERVIIEVADCVAIPELEVSEEKVISSAECFGSAASHSTGHSGCNSGKSAQRGEEGISSTAWKGKGSRR